MKKKIKIALVGNPNSGKSSVFNILTGLNQKIANFPGITVEKKTGFCILAHSSNGEKIDADIIDLPGTYSLYPKSLDERVPFQVLCDTQDLSHPDLVVFIADASNLKRSLFLCSQIIDLKIPTVLALNMMDIVKAKGMEINIQQLTEQLGIPILPINALKKEGIDELKNAVVELCENEELENRRVGESEKNFINIYPLAPQVIDAIKEITGVSSNYSAFQLANNFEIIKYLRFEQGKKEQIKEVIQRFGFDVKKLQVQETLERYKIITDIINQSVKQVATETKKQHFKEKLDKILTHKVWGYFFFLLILFLVFQAIFSWSSYPMGWIQDLFSWTSEWIKNTLPKGVLNDLIVNGILAGLSGIVVFVPQIAFLFAFIAILEDSGYMARVSFIMDRLMRPFGLNGKSVIPLISGVACAVPAIMSTRTIQNWKERIITIMITPLISCSARIPVYTLLISMVVPSKFVLGIFNLQGLVMMMLYLIGVLSALMAAFVMKFIIKAKERSFFIMEMPIYRMPRWSNVGLTMLEKVKVFLFDAGKIIVAISIVLWVLSSFGPDGNFKKIEQKYQSTEMTSSLPQQEINNKIQTEKLQASYAGTIGKWLEPVIRPLGFDWKIGIALVTSFAAREVFVGTMATLYSVGDANVNTVSVRDKMLAEINPATGKPQYSMAVGFSLMIFYVFAMQCMSTLAVVYRETRNWKWPVLQFVYLGILAYSASMIAFQLLK